MRNGWHFCFVGHVDISQTTMLLITFDIIGKSFMSNEWCIELHNVLICNGEVIEC